MGRPARGCIALAMLTLVLAAGHDRAAANDGYRLLRLDGHLVKWGTPKLGTGTTITYGFVLGRREFRAARNCRGMAPMDGMLADAGLSWRQMRQQTSAALASWSRVADIRFREASVGETADILIGVQLKPRGRAFANVAYEGEQPLAGTGKRRPSVSGAGLAMARRRFARGSSAATGAQPPKRIRQALVCLNPRWRWKIGFDGDLQSYDLRYTLIHEIGHAIGLDHSGARGQLMSFRYREDFSELQPGDIAGAIRLYGAAR